MMPLKRVCTVMTPWKSVYAVNDALEPYSVEINELPMRARDIEAALNKHGS